MSANPPGVDPQTGFVVDYEAYLAAKLPEVADDELRAVLNDFIEYVLHEAVHAVSAELKRRGID